MDPNRLDDPVAIGFAPTIAERDALARAYLDRGHSAEETIAQLQTLWHGDDPMECRLAWEAIERVSSPQS